MVLVVSSLKKSFGPRVLWENIDLRAERGTLTGLIGASGSGKSTLLYSISGMDRPTSGTVRLEGRDLTGLSDKEMSRVRLTRMGFVFQQAYFLSNLTIRDNVLLPALKADPRRAGEAASRVDALLDRFGIGHVKQHGITEVSGGQLQRASICRALASEPTIVFADEPTGALNSSMTAEVMDALSGVHAEGRTIVMVTHDPACAARADRVVYLKDGRLVDSRSMERWHPEQATQREDDLLAWLRGLGF